MPKSKVLFLGLGRMGFHMSAHLSKSKNIELFIYNRSKKKENDWLKSYKAKKFDFKNSINLKFDIIITCLKDDHSINQVTNNLLKSSCFHKNTIFIDHSTISLSQVEKLNKLLNKNKIKFLDAPVTGGEEGAKNARLSVMVGGNISKFKLALPIIKTYSKSVVHMGNTGSGQLAKFTNQILICGILYSISEAFIFSKHHKINQNKLYDVIKNGAAGSWQFSNRYMTLIKNKFNFGFSTELMEKDLRYVLKQSKKSKLNLKLTKEVHQKFK
jgi:3-hydroxyisobutyrate dehydrogenase-like beta-hydroxyacid dehydrogenase